MSEHLERAPVWPRSATPASPEPVRVDEMALLPGVAKRVDPAVFEVSGWEVTAAGFVLRGRLMGTVEQARAHVASLASAALGREPRVLVHQDPDGRPYLLVLDSELERELERATPKHRPMLNLALFVATLATTTFAGAAHRGVDLLASPSALTVGLPYGLGVMLVLGVHEMGHYVAARRHGVHVSLPYFVPIPFGLGTFGAFISMPALLKSRRQLFDIGVAGPLAGLAVAIPALAIGLRWSTVLPVDGASSAHMGQGVSANASILLAVVAKLSIGSAVASGHYLVLHPLAFAGWLGLIITALNLLPVGQLDGGHMSHALFGSARAAWIGKLALGGMVVLGLLVWSGLLFWALVVYLIAGRAGIPPADDVTPLDGKRRAVAWLAFALLVAIVLPLPHSMSSLLGLHCPYI